MIKRAGEVERVLAEFKVPTLFDDHDSLSKTLIGKIMKYQLRADHAAANMK